MTPEQLLATVALITASANAIALIIHSLRVPYRESNAAETAHLTEAGIKLRQSVAQQKPEQTTRN